LRSASISQPARQPRTRSPIRGARRRVLSVTRPLCVLSILHLLVMRNSRAICPRSRAGVRLSPQVQSDSTRVSKTSARIFKMIHRESNQGRTEPGAGRWRRAGGVRRSVPRGPSALPRSPARKGRKRNGPFETRLKG
jgi:hypothetical protein